MFVRSLRMCCGSQHRHDTGHLTFTKYDMRVEEESWSVMSNLEVGCNTQTRRVQHHLDRGYE